MKKVSYTDSRASDAFELLEVGCLYFPRVTGSLVLLHPWHMDRTVLNAFFSSSTTEQSLIVATVSTYIREFSARVNYKQIQPVLNMIHVLSHNGSILCHLQ